MKHTISEAAMDAIKHYKSLDPARYVYPEDLGVYTQGLTDVTAAFAGYLLDEIKTTEEESA